MKIWKDYITEDDISVTEEAVRAIKTKMIEPCWRTLLQYPDAVHEFIGFIAEPIKETMEKIGDAAKKLCRG